MPLSLQLMAKWLTKKQKRPHTTLIHCNSWLKKIFKNNPHATLVATHGYAPMGVHISVHDAAAVEQLSDVGVLAPLEADLTLNDLQIIIRYSQIMVDYSRIENYWKALTPLEADLTLNELQTSELSE